MQYDEYKFLKEDLREGVTYERYGYFAGEPNTGSACYLMERAADAIVDLQEENDKLRQKLNKRQKLIDSFFRHFRLLALGCASGELDKK